MPTDRLAQFRPLLVGPGRITPDVREKLTDAGILYGAGLRVVQGSQRRHTRNSAWTHTGVDGGLDLSRLQANGRCVKCLRLVDAAAWVRDEAHGGFVPHIHVVWNPEYFSQHPSADDQWYDLYHRGGAGLASGRRDYHDMPSDAEKARARERIAEVRRGSVEPALDLPPAWRTQLKRGARNGGVRTLQARLNYFRDQDDRLPVDGHLGPRTEADVVRYAKGHGLGDSFTPAGYMTVPVYDSLFPDNPASKTRIILARKFRRGSE